MNYDVHFCTLAASDPLLRWDVRLTDSWLECFSGTLATMTRWPCVHCGATTHYPESCLFHAQSVPELLRRHHPSFVSTSTGGQHSPLTRPSLDNLTTADQPWHNQAANSHEGLAMPLTVQSAAVFPLTSYTSVEPVTVPGPVSTGTVPLSKLC